MTILTALLLMNAVPYSTLAPFPENDWVPFTLTRAQQIRFTVTIDGRAVEAILDTGATRSTVSRRFAAAARLPITPGPGAVTIGGRVASGWTVPHVVAFGALRRTGARLAVADLPTAATGGDTIDMLIGTDVTAHYALDIDYDARRFRLLPSGRMPFRGSVAPLRIAADWGFYVTELTLAGIRVGRIVIDTGDGTALGVSQRTMLQTGLPAATTTTLDYGVGGASVVGLAALAEIGSGALAIRNVEMRIEPPRGFADATGMAGRIGSGLLRRYRVLLDPDAGRMVLAAGRDADRPPLRSTSGFLLAVRRDRLDVLHVMRGSPAQRAGWRTGDTICAVDGATIDADYTNDRRAGWPVAEEGRTVSLTDCTGGIHALTLARFY